LNWNGKFSKSDIQKLAGTSRSTVLRVESGREINDPVLKDKINKLFNFNESLIKLFSDPLFNQVLEIAIMKSRNSSHTKFAVLLQQASNRLTNNLTNELITAQELNEIFEYESSLRNYFLAPEFPEVCEIVIKKGRSSKVIKYAVLLQQASNDARYRLDLHVKETE